MPDREAQASRPSAGRNDVLALRRRGAMPVHHLRRRLTGRRARAMLNLPRQRQGERMGSVTAIQPGIAELLEASGAKPRGNRHDCAKCSGYRTVTHSAEAFLCHRCGWRGNTVTLAKELGIYQRVPKAEYIRQRNERQRAETLARQFLAACRDHRLAFNALYCLMQQATDEAHEKLKSNPEDEAAWDCLAWAYQNEREVLAVCLLLSEGAIADRRRWLEGSPEERENIISKILLAGGLADGAGRFVEVNA